MSSQSRASFALVVVCVGAHATTIGAQGSSAINLRQTASLIVPAGFEVSGAALSQNGALVFWSRESKAVRWSDGRRIRELCLGIDLNPLAAAFNERSKKIEIVDAQTGRIYQADAGGSCRVKYTLGRAGPVHAAAYARGPGQWFGLMKRDGRTLVVVVQPDGRRGQLRLPYIPEQDLVVTHMTASRAGVVFSRLRPPFAWQSVAPTGRIISAGRPFGVDTTIKVDSDSAVGSNLLFGTPVRAIDSGFIQLLSDPRTDVRVLVTYASNGRPNKISTIKLSLGLLDFEPSTNRLLALRRTDIAELVTYSLNRPVRHARSP